VDVDAVTISLARLSTQELPPRESALGIFVASASNSLVKGGISVAIGGWAFGWKVLAAFLGMVAAGAAGAAYLVLR
jgi:uncharacterized membrane protein (DUF4010 family)